MCVGGGGYRQTDRDRITREGGIIGLRAFEKREN